MKNNLIEVTGLGTVFTDVITAPGVRFRLASAVFTVLTDGNVADRTLLVEARFGGLCVWRVLATSFQTATLSWTYTLAPGLTPRTSPSGTYFHLDIPAIWLPPQALIRFGLIDAAGFDAISAACLLELDDCVPCPKS